MHKESIIKDKPEYGVGQTLSMMTTVNQGFFKKLKLLWCERYTPSRPRFRVVLMMPLVHAKIRV